MKLIYAIFLASFSMFAAESPTATFSGVMSPPMMCSCTSLPCNCNQAKPMLVPPVSTEPKKLVCEDGRSYKLPEGAEAPEGCKWVPLSASNALENDSEDLTDDDADNENSLAQMKLVCADGRKFKLVPGTPAPEGCSWESSYQATDIAPDLELDDSASQSMVITENTVLPKVNPFLKPTCQCIKAPCVCPSQVYPFSISQVNAY